MTAPEVVSPGQAVVVRSDAGRLPLAASMIDLIVTSPPYFGLRSYQDAGVHYEDQIGAEATPADYLDALLACTAEWLRVLKPSGSIFVNLGDKYERKSLTALPWRYAIRCLDELPLLLRAEIVWSKPNGLPESVKDRVRRSHETWLHFTPGPRYFADLDEIREPLLHPVWSRPGRSTAPSKEVRNLGDTSALRNAGYTPNPLGKLPGSVWSIPTQPLQVPAHLGVDHFAAFPMEWPRRIIKGWCPPGGTVLDPFGGTGTTAMVAAALGRVGLSVDLSHDYCRLARWRSTDPRQQKKAAA